MNLCQLGAFSACVITLLSPAIQAMPVNGQGTWESTLEGRDLDGNALTFEAYYDSALDITWLADTNANGAMTWDAANTWANTLNVNGVTGWRLPTTTPINGSSYNFNVSSNGSTDGIFAATTTDGSDGGWRDDSGTPVSEMGNMFYVTLGNLGLCKPSQPICDTQSGFGISNTGPFSNLQPNIYWSESESVLTSRAFYFNYGIGGQTTTVKNLKTLAWAVRSGDVSIIPIPASIWLFGSGIFVLLGFSRKINK